MKSTCALASRDSIQAFYRDGNLIVVASGKVSAGDQVDIDMVQPPTTPLEFSLLRCPKPGVWPDVMVTYTYRETFRITTRPDSVRIAGTIRVRHADGVDEVPLTDMPAELEPFAATLPGAGADEATGESPNLSFDEAFANALRNLPEPGTSHPDQLTRVKVEEIGAVFGGFAGFHHLYVRVSATRD